MGRRIEITANHDIGDRVTFRSGRSVFDGYVEWIEVRDSGRGLSLSYRVVREGFRQRYYPGERDVVAGKVRPWRR